MGVCVLLLLTDQVIAGLRVSQKAGAVLLADLAGASCMPSSGLAAASFLPRPVS